MTVEQQILESVQHIEQLLDSFVPIIGVCVCCVLVVSFLRWCIRL